MNINICAPSYKRANKVDTLKYLPSCKIYVSNDEYNDYKQNNPTSNIIGVDPKYQGNLCRIRNKILDDHQGNIVCIIDDDLKYVGYYENRKIIKIENENDFFSFLYKYSVLALDFGVKLWGINVNPDKQCYREYTPFSLTSYIGGPFMVHIDTTLRFDERLPLKEDYDFTLQNLNKYRKALRINKYFYNVKQCEQIGGCSNYRNLENEKNQLLLLQKKWGKKIVKTEKLTSNKSHKSKKKKNFDINPIIVVPILGI